MRTLVYGKYLIRGAGERRQIVKNGAACVEGSIIKDVGDFKVLSKSYKYDLKVGSEKHIVMPGLINSHDHGNAISLILRGISDGPLETWVQDFFYRGMEGWKTYVNVMLSCINQIENGVICLFNDYYCPFDLLDCNAHSDHVESELRATVDAG